MPHRTENQPIRSLYYAGVNKSHWKACPECGEIFKTTRVARTEPRKAADSRMMSVAVASCTVVALVTFLVGMGGFGRQGNTQTRDVTPRGSSSTTRRPFQSENPAAETRNLPNKPTPQTTKPASPQELRAVVYSQRYGSLGELAEMMRSIDEEVRDRERREIDLAFELRSLSGLNTGRSVDELRVRQEQRNNINTQRADNQREIQKLKKSKADLQKDFDDWSRANATSRK